VHGFRVVLGDQLGLPRGIPLWRGGRLVRRSGLDDRAEAGQRMQHLDEGQARRMRDGHAISAAHPRGRQ
jgi:hypothetical protein